MSIYQNSFVLFLDILGWGKLIERTKNSIEEHEHLLSILNQIKEISDFQSGASDTINNVLGDYNFDLGGVANVKSIQFSDSLVFSFCPNLASFTQVFAMVSGLSSIFAKHGYFLRGGLDFGQIHHEGNVIFGPALNCSYLLECDYAKYPRIILSDKALDKTKAINVPKGFLFQDTDFYCLNNLSEIAKVDSIMEVLTFNCNKFEHDERVLNKYEWLKTKIGTML